MVKLNIRQTTANFFEGANNTRRKSLQAIANLFTVRSHPELRKLTPEQQQAFWTILFSLAIADGTVDEDENHYLNELSNGDREISELFTTLKNSTGSFERIDSHIAILADIETVAQWRLLFWGLELALIDKEFHETEKAALTEICETFSISPEQFQVLLDLVNLLHLNTEQGLSGPTFSEQFTELVNKADKLNICLPHELQKMNNQNLGEYEQYYSGENLQKKLAGYALTAGKKTIEIVLILFYTLQRSDLPHKYKLVIIGALGYWILPSDLLPDLMPAIGYTDDLSTLVMAMTVVASHINDEVRQKAKDKLAEWFGKESEEKKELPS